MRKLWELVPEGEGEILNDPMDDQGTLTEISGDQDE